MVKATFPLPDVQVTAVVEEASDLFAVKVRQGGAARTLRVNLAPTAQGGLGPHVSLWADDKAEESLLARLPGRTCPASI